MTRSLAMIVIALLASATTSVAQEAISRSLTVDNRPAASLVFSNAVSRP